MKETLHNLLTLPVGGAYSSTLWTGFRFLLALSFAMLAWNVRQARWWWVRATASFTAILVGLKVLDDVWSNGAGGPLILYTALFDLGLIVLLVAASQFVLYRISKRQGSQVNLLMPDPRERP